MKKLEKGFTLIELMIVVAIIAILAAVAAPKFGQQIKKSKDAKALSIVGNWRSGSSLYYADNGDYAPTTTAFAVLKDHVDAATIKATSSGNPSGQTATVTAGAIATGTVVTMTYTGATSDGAITLSSGLSADGKTDWSEK